MKEENELFKKVGTGNPFMAPEGYFEQLTSEVMNKLPKQQESRFVMKKVARWARVKPWAYMAAVFAGVVFVLRIVSYNPNSFDDMQIAATETAAADSEMVYDEYIDYVVNQSMMDDYSLYMYLTDASAD